MKTLSQEFNWEYYGGKHYESVFTKFYQAYILPRKFDIDKRKGHLSALIRNGEITRENALKELKLPLYSKDELRNDYDYIAKKLGFSKDEFEQILNAKPISHDHYKSDIKYAQFLIKLWKKYLAKEEITTL